MVIQTKRIYDEPARGDGFRVLVDRLWPRGLTKDDAAVDVWAKAIAPSTELRKAFHADPEQWGEFKKQYRAELRENKDEIDVLLMSVKASRKRTVTLLTAAKEERNHVKVLVEVLGKRV